MPNNHHGQAKMLIYMFHSFFCIHIILKHFVFGKINTYILHHFIAFRYGKNAHDFVALLFGETHII